MKFSPPILSCSYENFCFHAGEYSFGFNGKDKESEFNSGAYDFGARIHDARLGRWMSVDPKVSNYPELSSFNFSFCNPIKFSDKSGMDPIEDILKKGQGSSTFLGLMNESKITLCNFSTLIKPSVRNLQNAVDARYQPAESEKGKGTIFIRASTIEAGVIALAHEMTNMKNGQALKAAQISVGYGFTTPEQYAETVATLEAEGIFNQIKVELELGILKTGHQSFYDLINGGKENELFEYLKGNALNSRIVANGKTAKEHYMEQGKKRRQEIKALSKSKSKAAPCDPASCKSDKETEALRAKQAEQCNK